MTPASLAALVRYRTKTNSTTFTNADMLPLVNAFKDEIAGMIQEAREDIWNMPAVDDLVLNQREYALPADMLTRLIYLKLKFTANGSYVLTKPINRLHFKAALNETDITNNFDSIGPRYFIRRNAIYILSGSIIAVPDGIKIVYDAFPADITSLTSEGGTFGSGTFGSATFGSSVASDDLSVDPSTTSLGFPRQFHELLARRVAIEYKERNDLALSKKDLQYDADLERKINDFSTGILDLSIIGAMPNSMDQESDNGFEL